MSRSSLTKPFRVMALLVASMLLLAVPASAAFLTFVEVHRDGEGGVDGLFGAHGVTASPDGAHIYVAGTYDDALAAFGRDTTTGKLTFLEVHWDNVGGVDGLDAVISVMVSPDGKHVYATSAADDAVVVFIRDVITGRLTFLEMHKDGVGGVDGLDRAERAAISPDGAYVYVAGQWDNALVAFSRNVTTGELTFVKVYWDGVDGVDGLDGASSVTVSPDGEHVYATSIFDEAVATFSRDKATGGVDFRRGASGWRERRRWPRRGPRRDGQPRREARLCRWRP
jgi:6-phosphogluconolactonase (cycloisomerase 2 family)